MPRESTSTVAGMSQKTKRSGSQFILPASVTVQYFFTTPYCQTLPFSRKKKSGAFYKLTCQANSFRLSEVRFFLACETVYLTL